MRLTIHRKLTLASLMMISLSALAAVIGLWQLVVVRQAADIAQYENQEALLALELRASGLSLVTALDEMLRSRDPLLMSTKVLPAVGAMDWYVDALGEMTLREREIEQDEFYRAIWPKLHEAHYELHQGVEDINLYARQGMWEEALLVHARQIQPANEQLAILMRRLALETRQRAEAAANRAIQAERRAVIYLIILTLAVVGVSLGWREVVFRTMAQSITELREGVERIARGELDHTIVVRTRDEIEELANEFNRMARSLKESRQALEQHAEMLEQRVAERTRELAEAVETQRQLLETVRKLGTPVIPVMKGIIVMPLIGTIDAQRAQQITRSLLRGIETHRARVALIDITGVPTVDTQVASYLLQAITSVRLLGAEPVLVGIRPEIAQTLVGLGVDLSGIVTRSDLQSGVEYAMGVMKR